MPIKDSDQPWHPPMFIRVFVVSPMDSRGGPRISRKGAHMYKGVGVRFADFKLHFPKYPMKMKSFGLLETKLLVFHRISKTGGWGGEFEGTPLFPS